MKTNPFLSEPDVKYKKSYLNALSEYSDDDTYGRRVEEKAEELKKDFESFVEKIKGEALGKNLKPGFVPNTTLWLIDNDEYIGRVNIRHTLNDNLMKIGGHIGYSIRPSKRGMGYGNKILALALPKARELGIDKVLITCDTTNIPSRKVIEKNGGILENEVLGEDGKSNRLRFWIG
jgi:predicted acetyltransferase